MLTSAFLRSAVRPSTKRSIWLPWLWNSSKGRRILIWRLSSIIVPKPCSAAAQTRLFIQYCIFTYFVRTDARTHCSTYRLDGQVCINIGVVDLFLLLVLSTLFYLWIGRQHQIQHNFDRPGGTLFKGPWLQVVKSRETISAKIWWSLVVRIWVFVFSIVSF